MLNYRLSSRRFKLMYPTPHLDKLIASLQNEKVPDYDKHRIEHAITEYKKWISNLENIQGSSSDEYLIKMVEQLNQYKNFIDINLIFDSEQDFLYRQKGQLKLDNSIIEEFLPRLIRPEIIPEIEGLDIELGPMSSFSAIYFSSSLQDLKSGAGLSVRSKDQDFTISKKIFIKASFNPDFSDSVIQSSSLAYVASECKTNLDKTMFQEACATAHDLKMAVSGAKYFLICEWLDMTPLSTAPTDIDEVLVLRKARRIGSHIRKNYSTYKGRMENREQYISILQNNPLNIDVFRRFIDHVRKLINDKAPVEADVLNNGYF